MACTLLIPPLKLFYNRLGTEEKLKLQLTSKLSLDEFSEPYPKATEEQLAMEQAASEQLAADLASATAAQGNLSADAEVLDDEPVSENELEQSTKNGKSSANGETPLASNKHDSDIDLGTVSQDGKRSCTPLLRLG